MADFGEYAAQRYTATAAVAAVAAVVGVPAAMTANDPAPARPAAAPTHPNPNVPCDVVLRIANPDGTQDTMVTTRQENAVCGRLTMAEGVRRCEDIVRTTLTPHADRRLRKLRFSSVELERNRLVCLARAKKGG